MPVITIIGCRMFEDEIMHLLENDPQIKKKCLWWKTKTARV
nr:hypothetical protein [Methanosarcina horonobensis]